jgi:hypothetical protein
MKQLILSSMFVMGIALIPAVEPANAQVRVGVSVGRVPPPPLGYVYGRPVGVCPRPGYVWRDGYYDYYGPRRGYSWVGGSWVRPPRARAVWVAPGWHGHSWRHGHWR